MQNEHESTDIIRIEHLNKTFGDVKAVRDLGFCVKKGELFAFLGVNGAGKSTTISILCGQLSKDSGTVQIKGIDNEGAGEQTKRLIGVVFQDSVLDKPLTVKENLKSRAALYGITGQAFEKRLQELLDILDFGDYLNRPVTKLSGGQRRRIDIARALLHRPEILILDEVLSVGDEFFRKKSLKRVKEMIHEAGDLECDRKTPHRGADDRFSDNPLHGRGCKCRVCGDSRQRQYCGGRNTIRVKKQVCAGHDFCLWCNRSTN